MLTIKKFLDLDMIPWYENLTNTPIPEDRPIEHVSVNDPPLDDFIRKNEMVITIATPYVKNEELMNEFIEGLIKANASIFLLAIPNNTLQLSEKSRQLAIEGNLPVLLIPWDVRFADICETILDRLRDDYNDYVEVLKTLQEDILKCFLTGSNITTASNIISKNLGCEVLITDTGNSRLTGNADIESRDMTKIPLKSGGHLYGFLYIKAVKSQELLMLLSRTISPLLSLWFYRDEIIERTQSMAKEDLIWSLANGSDPDSEKISRSAKLMNLHLHRFYACIVGRVQLKTGYSDEWQKNWIDSNINTISDSFIKAAKSLKKEAMITHHNNVIITYLETAPALGKAQISKFLDLVEEVTPKNIIFSWGISEINDSPTDFRNSYLHAKLAEELCLNDMRFRKRYYYENTLIYNMMSTLSSNEEFMKKAYDILDPIIEYDKMRNRKLMETLRVYLIYKNISEAARKLDIHRQTILYQLEKIEDLTGMSLKNNDELFLLEICMRLHMDFTFSNE